MIGSQSSLSGRSVCALHLFRLPSLLVRFAFVALALQASPLQGSNFASRVAPSSSLRSSVPPRLAAPFPAQPTPPPQAGGYGFQLLVYLGALCSKPPIGTPRIGFPQSAPKSPYLLLCPEFTLLYFQVLYIAFLDCSLFPQSLTAYHRMIIGSCRGATQKAMFDIIYIAPF